MDMDQIIVDHNTFDVKGDLLPMARINYWLELSRQMELFDKFKLELKPEPEKRSEHPKTTAVRSTVSVVSNR